MILYANFIFYLYYLRKVIYFIKPPTITNRKEGSLYLQRDISVKIIFKMFNLS